MTSKVIQGSKGGKPSVHTPWEMEDNLASMDRIKILLGVSDGEVDQNFDMTMLRFNEVPVQNPDGSFNFEGVKAEFRHGIQTQEYIKGMQDSVSEFTVNRVIKKDNPFNFTVNNNSLSAIRIKMFLPRGLKVESNGDKVGVHVVYAVDFAVDGGSFYKVFEEAIDGKTTSGYDRSRRLDLPQFNKQVIVRVRRVTEDSKDVNLIDEIQLKSYGEVIDSKLFYPLTGLLFVEFDSKMFPTQIPTISVKKKWKLINVPTNYDPIKREYSGTWDGQFKFAWSNNPAWVLYDLITNQRYGVDQKELGISVDKWSLYQAAQYCDVMVPDGKGGMEPRYLCDVVIQSQVEAFKLIRDICSIFRGMSFWNGESLSIVTDRPRDASYIFTNDNVVGGSFTYTFASEKSMYTVCNVMFDNEENSYQQDQEAVFDNDAMIRFGNNVTSITAIGCTRRSEANRRGRWILKTNLRSTTVSFTTGLEGMIPMIGDVVAVADNFWSSNLTLNLSGRVMEVTGLQVFLPFKVDARPGDFIIVNRPDGKPVKRTIASLSADGKTINLNTAFGFTVAPNTVFAIDRTDIALQQFVVTAISRGDDEESFTYKIDAVEYDPNKYDEIDLGVSIDERPTSIVDPDNLKAPKNVKVSSESRIVQGMSVETMIISWDQVQYASYYDVQWRKDNSNWQNVPQTPNKEVFLEGIYAGSYQVRVRAVASSGSTSPWSEVVNANLRGKVGAPGAPQNIQATDDVVFGIRVKWGFTEGSGDTAYTELQQSPDGKEGTASLLTMVPFPQHEYYHSPMPGGHVVWYRARTVDRIGNVSAWTPFARGMASTDVESIIGEIKVDIESSEGYQWLHKNAVDDAADIASNAEAAIENALANDRDVIHMEKQNDNRKAEYIKSVKLIADETQARVTAIEQLKASVGEDIKATNSELREVIATESKALSQRIDQLKVQIDEEVTAQITDVRKAVATEAETRASADTALSTRLGKNEAALSQKLDSWATVDSIGAMYGVKLGLTYQGRNYDAGLALSLVGTPGGVKSQLLVDAGRLAINTGMGTNAQYPFIVQGTQTIINSALIGDASITNAKIGNYIQSNNYVWNDDPNKRTGWVINKNGDAVFANGQFAGGITARWGSLDNVVINENCTINGTLSANNIRGDIYATKTNGWWLQKHNAGGGAYRRWDLFWIELHPDFERKISFKGILRAWNDGGRGTGSVGKIWCGNHLIMQVGPADAGAMVDVSNREFILPRGNGGQLIWIEIQSGFNDRTDFYVQLGEWTRGEGGGVTGNSIPVPSSPLTVDLMKNSDSVIGALPNNRWPEGW